MTSRFAVPLLLSIAVGVLLALALVQYGDSGELSIRRVLTALFFVGVIAASLARWRAAPPGGS